MNAYYCIVSMPGVPVREICVVPAADDAAAVIGAQALTATWIGFETISLYHGERVVRVLSNPALGFPAVPLTMAAPDDIAA